jgi:hypothetical protein
LKFLQSSASSYYSCILNIFSGAVFSLIAVGVLWGATNPFIKKGSSGVENVKAPHSSLQLLYEFQYLMCRWQVRT